MCQSKGTDTCGGDCNNCSNATAAAVLDHEKSLKRFEKFSTAANAGLAVSEQSPFALQDNIKKDVL